MQVRELRTQPARSGEAHLLAEHLDSAAAFGMGRELPSNAADTDPRPMGPSPFRLHAPLPTTNGTLSFPLHALLSRGPWFEPHGEKITLRTCGSVRSSIDLS